MRTYVKTACNISKGDRFMTSKDAFVIAVSDASWTRKGQVTVQVVRETDLAKHVAGEARCYSVLHIKSPRTEYLCSKVEEAVVDSARASIANIVKKIIESKCKKAKEITDRQRNIADPKAFVLHDGTVTYAHRRVNVKLDGGTFEMLLGNDSGRIIARCHTKIYVRRRPGGKARGVEYESVTNVER